MSKTLICSQWHTIYRCCNNLQFNILFHNFVKLAFCSSLIYIMYIRGFDLASDTQTGSYLRGLDLTQSAFGLLQCTRF